MGRKLGLTVDQVIEAAAEIADRDGLDDLSLASLAEALGIRSPSLYSHVEGLAGLRRQLTLHASSQLAAELAVSVQGLEGSEALTALAQRMRLFAHRHPGLYDSLLPAPTPEDDPELAAALAEPDASRLTLFGEQLRDRQSVTKRPGVVGAQIVGARLGRPELGGQGCGARAVDRAIRELAQE